MNIIAHIRFTETTSRSATLLDPFPEGCDPDFDAGLDDLERAFAELRLQFGE